MSYLKQVLNVLLAILDAFVQIYSFVFVACLIAKLLIWCGVNLAVSVIIGCACVVGVTRQYPEVKVWHRNLNLLVVRAYTDLRARCTKKTA